VKVEGWGRIESVIEKTLSSFLTTDGPMILHDVPKVMGKIRKAVEEVEDTELKKKSVKPLALAPDVGKTIEQAEKIIELTEDLPDKAMEFGESVADRCQGIAGTLEVSNRVTKAQQEALDNMEAAVRKWLD